MGFGGVRVGVGVGVRVGISARVARASLAAKERDAAETPVLNIHLEAGETLAPLATWRGVLGEQNSSC